MTRKRRKVITAYANCGSHGMPWVHMAGPGAAPGQFAIFETPRQALGHYDNPKAIRRVRIYIDAECLPDLGAEKP